MRKSLVKVTSYDNYDIVIYGIYRKSDILLCKIWPFYNVHCAVYSGLKATGQGISVQ